MQMRLGFLIGNRVGLQVGHRSIYLSLDGEAEDGRILKMDEHDRPVPDKTTLERLGRERPATFPNKWIELCFCFSLLASELLAVCLPSFYIGLSNFTGILH
jgi:hypothetical protein